MMEPGPDIHPPTNDDVFIAASDYSNWIVRLTSCKPIAQATALMGAAVDQ